MIDVLVEETTTLPEGAQISVCRFRNKSDKRDVVFTELLAARGDRLVKMRCDNFGPNSLRSYLDYAVREIIRRRLAMTAKPERLLVPLEKTTRADNFADFVSCMAHSDMFIFDAISTKLLADEPNTTGDKKVPRTGGKTPRKRKRKDNQSSTGRTTNSAQ